MSAITIACDEEASSHYIQLSELQNYDNWLATVESMKIFLFQTEFCAKDPPAFKIKGTYTIYKIYWVCRLHGVI